MLGSLAVRRDGRTVVLGGRKHATLLAALLVDAGRTVSVDALVDALWPQGPPATARTLVQQYAGKLRRILEPGVVSGRASTILHTRAPGYVLDLDGHVLDAARFAELVAHARSRRDAGDLAGALRLYDEAAALWRGPAYAEFAYDDFAAAEVRRLTAERLIATEERLGVEIALGRHREVAGALEALVDEHPDRQELWRLHMLVLYRTGREAEALAAFRRIRDRLVAEHGVEPGAPLDAMHHAILRRDQQLDVPAVRPRRRGNLAPALSSFVGRRDDLDDVVELLAHHRLVTLTGLSGVGKTRLATEAAARLRDELPGAVWVVEPDRAAGEDSVWQTVAAAVGAQDHPGGDTAAAVADRLGGAGTLVVLDGCEHSVHAVATVVRTLLARCDGLRVLATSRVPLDLDGEVRYGVATLPTPPRDAPADRLASFEAVRLFIDRVHAADPHVDLAGDLSTVAEICRRLDGLPLAIELAAARVRALSVPELAARLDQRFALLVDARGRRERSLRDLVEWTVAQLDAGHRQLFADLAVFAGGFTLDAASAVAGHDVLDTLSGLVDWSVVTVRRSDRDVRYVMLDTLRAYADELLGDGRHRVAAAHRAWCAHQAVIHARRLQGGDPVTALGWFDDEHDNLDAAQRSALAVGDAAAALHLATDCELALQMRGRHTQSLGWLTRALDCHTGPPTPLTTAALAAAGSVERERARFPQARRLLRAALRQARETGDDSTVADVRLRLAWPTQDDGDLDEATRLASDALPVLRRGDRPLLVAQCLLLLAQIDRRRGRMGRHDPLSEEARRIAEDADSLWMRAWSRLSLALSGHAGGDMDAAARHARASFDLMHALGFPRGQVWSLDVLATAAFARDDTQRALLLLGATQAMRDRAPAPIPRSQSADLDAQLAHMRTLAARPSLMAWYQRGRTLGALEIAATV